MHTPSELLVIKKIEESEDADEDAAIQKTAEELGLDPDRVKIIWESREA